MKKPKKWKEPENCKWSLVEYEYATCSICGTMVYMGFTSHADAQSKWDKDHLWSYCPNCGAKMFEDKELELPVYDGKDEMPSSPDEVDGWLDKVQLFNDAFVELIKVVVYLFQMRHMVNSDTLKQLSDSAATALRQLCDNCKAIGKCGKDCPVFEHLEELKAPKL